MVTGPLSQALRLSRLLDADLEDHRLWAGHDLLYVYFAISTVWKTLINSILFPLLNSVVIWFVNPLNLLFCFRSVCYGCMIPTTYVWVTCRDPGICGSSGSHGMPDGLPFSPFEVRDDSNPSGDGLSHLNRIKLGGAATSATSKVMSSVRKFSREPNVTGNLIVPSGVAEVLGMTPWNGARLCFSSERGI